jgi:hypothetical protein
MNRAATRAVRARAKPQAAAAVTTRVAPRLLLGASECEAAKL